MQSIIPALRYSRNFAKKAFTSSTLENKNNYKRIMFMIGPPGAGKGTQSERLAKEYNMLHISAGELLRLEQARNSETGRIITKYLNDGKIVPVSITLALVKAEIEKTKAKSIIIDGFPRNFDNINGWNATMNHSVYPIDCAVLLDSSVSELQERILKRGITSGRDDDNIEKFNQRYSVYLSDTIPVVEYFAKLGLLRTLNGSQPVDCVYRDLKSIYNSAGQ